MIQINGEKYGQKSCIRRGPNIKNANLKWRKLAKVMPSSYLNKWETTKEEWDRVDDQMFY